MAKKYSPNGYQIIDLGEHDLSSTILLTEGENADADVLIELRRTNRLWNKPILLKIYDTDGQISYVGVPVIREYELYLIDKYSVIAVTINDDGTIDIEMSAL